MGALTTTRSSSDKMAWSTCHPLCKCANIYDILMVLFYYPEKDNQRKNVLNADHNTDTHKSQMMLL
jgi:hypothetical protein